MRVLMWILARCDEKVDAVETPIGYMPKPEDINIEGLESEGVTLDVMKELLSVDKSLWKEDIEGVKAFYEKIGDRMPKELYDQLAAFEARLDQ